MDLGEKIRAARLEIGLSQRQLCGETITRNMLSQIEHGTARPSMDTLRYLAARLGKPVSFFLEEDAVSSPNQVLMAQARERFRAGDPASVPELLEKYRAPDPIFDDEAALLRCLCLLAAAQQAIREGRLPYGRHLLEQAEEAGRDCIYYTFPLERERLLLLSQADPEQTSQIVKELPMDDRELLLRAQVSLETDPVRAGQYLDAAQDQASDQWHLLRAEVCFAEKDYAGATIHYHRAEAAFPRSVHSKLEICYRELGDFKKAYEYACKQR
jgi:transcriptional regulator with XRE-family HTH domain